MKTRPMLLNARVSLLVFTVLIPSLSGCPTPGGGASTTPPGGTPSSPSSLTAGSPIVYSNAQLTSVTLTWGAASDPLTKPDQILYKVVWAQTSDTISTTGKVDAIGTSASGLVRDWTKNITTSTATNLIPGATLLFAVVAKDTANNEVLYSPVSVALPVPAPQPGEIMVFFDVSTGGATQYFPSIGGSVSSSGYAHLCYRPAINYTKLISTWSSDSIAPHNDWIETVSGNSYVIENWGQSLDVISSAYSSSASTVYIRMFDGSVGMSNGNVEYVALTSTNLFYTHDYHYDMFHGKTNGGDLAAYNLATRTTSTIQSNGYLWNASNGTFFGLADGLYSGLISGTGTLTISRRDQATGSIISAVATANLPNYSSYENYKWAMSTYGTFIVRGTLDHQTTQILKIPSGSTTASVVYTTSLTDNYANIDVDGSAVLLGYGSSVVIYDDFAGQGRQYSFGTNIGGAQVLLYQ